MLFRVMQVIVKVVEIIVPQGRDLHISTDSARSILLDRFTAVQAIRSIIQNHLFATSLTIVCLVRDSPST